MMTVKEILANYHPEGIRVIATYRCNKRCKFCYQSGYKSPDLEPERLDRIFDQLKGSGFVPIYITYQGGEITVINEATRYFEVGQRRFPQTYRQSLTTNGTADLDWYKKCKMYGITHFTVSLHEPNIRLEEKIKSLASDGFFSVRVNFYLDQKNPYNLRHAYNFCKDNNIQLTLCEDLKNQNAFNSVHYVEDVVGLSNYGVESYKHQSIVRVPDHNFVFWIYRHLDHYDYNNIIVLPNGELSMTFDDVLKGVGCGEECIKES